MAASKVVKMILSLVFLGILGSALSQETSEGLSPEEMAEMFPEATDKEYEIIPIHKSRLQKRGLNGGFHLHLKAFGNDINLWLNPSEGTLASYATPVWLLYRNFNLIKQENIMQRVIPNMYQERSSSATLFINKLKEGSIQLYGTIGNNQYYIQPFPNGNNRRYPRSADNNTEAHSDYSYHIIYKMPNGLNYLNNFRNPLQNFFKPQSNQNNQYTNIDTVYPEIMVVIDYPLFAKMNHSIDIAVRYTLAFFNGVDLKYRSFENPKYRLNVAGIIVTAEAGALSYTNHVYNTEPYYLNADSVLRDAEPWMGKLGQLIGAESFDASITLTPRPLCVNKGNVCAPGSIGYANVGLNCKPFTYPNNPNLIMRRNSGVVHDNVDFEGIRTAAHELGHLFGVNHDGDNWKNKNCNSEMGNIMTPSVKLTNKGSEWSYCSLKEFEEFLDKEPVCLFNRPKQSDELVSRFLPGQWEDANEQCYHWVGTKAWVIDESICERLLCVDPKNPQYNWAEFEAAEGTRCGENSICLHNKCVPVPQI